MKRRNFLERLAKGAGAVTALWTLSAAGGCDAAEAAADGADLGMHGPVKEATESLQLPAATSAMGLFAPFDDGRPFQRGWAIAHVGRGYDDQLVIVLVDLQTGGHAELELWRIDPLRRPIAASETFGVYLHNAGRGDAQTPPHLEKLATALADIVAANERQVTVAWELPELGQRRRLL